MKYKNHEFKNLLKTDKGKIRSVKIATNRLQIDATLDETGSPHLNLQNDVLISGSGSCKHLSKSSKCESGSFTRKKLPYQSCEIDLTHMPMMIGKKCKTLRRTKRKHALDFSDLVKKEIQLRLCKSSDEKVTVSNSIILNGRNLSDPTMILVENL